MHTYRKAVGGTWEVVFQQTDIDAPIGPDFTRECEAAAFASFLNGGRYCPDEIAPIFAVPLDEEADDEPEDHTTPPSKSRFTDYPQEATQRHK